MLMDQAQLQPGHRVLIWGAAGGLGVFATQLCKIAGAQSVGVVSSAEKGELVKQLGAVDYIDRNEFIGMMRKGGETPEEDKARFKESRALQPGGRGEARRRAGHRLRARRQSHVPDVSPRASSRSVRSSSAARPRASSSTSTFGTSG